MKSKVKKFFKWFLIVILVVAAVGTTVFVFFKKYNAKQIKQVDLNDVLTASSKQNFDNGLNDVITILNANGGANWFTSLKTTSVGLDNSLDVLSNYYCSEGFKVKEKNISDTYSSMIITRDLLNDMFEEYKIKSESAYFQKLIGANDIYLTYSNYIVKYARFVQAVNNNVKAKDGFDCSSDIKFSVIDLQTRVAISGFSKLTKNGQLNKIENANNIDEMNKYVVYENSYIKASNGFGLNALRFIQYYDVCNKNALAENFKSELLAVSEITETSTSEQKVAYYFKKMF